MHPALKYYRKSWRLKLNAASVVPRISGDGRFHGICAVSKRGRSRLAGSRARVISFSAHHANREART